jgi:hypothetical protein
MQRNCKCSLPELENESNNTAVVDSVLLAVFCLFLIIVEVQDPSAEAWQ